MFLVGELLVLLASARDVAVADCDGELSALSLAYACLKSMVFVKSDCGFFLLTGSLIGVELIGFLRGLSEGGDCNRGTCSDFLLPGVLRTKLNTLCIAICGSAACCCGTDNCPADMTFQRLWWPEAVVPC